MEAQKALEVLVSSLLIFGLFFLLAGSLGLLRFQDVYSRMHATSKSTTLGVAGVLLAALLYLRFLEVSSGLKELLILGFLFLTAPVGAHMIARAAYHIGVALWQGGVVDEFKDWHEKQRARSASAQVESRSLAARQRASRSKGAAE